MSRGHAMWAAVDRLVDRADPPRLRTHRLHLLAARRWRSLGRAVPEELREEERLVALRELAVPALLGRARDAYDGRLMVMKGPAVAAAYPDPATRAYWDVDLLADDVHAAQSALLAAGFVEVGHPSLFRDIHHLRPLAWPGLPLAIELHHRPKWPAGMVPPHPRGLFEAAVPGGPGGLPFPDPAQHAVLLAAHAWAHRPLRRLGDLLDVQAIVAGAEPQAVAVARAWGCERLWGSTVAAAAALFGDRRPPLSLRVWARHLAGVRERTVVEGHLTTWLSPVWSAPRHRAAASAAAVAADLRPGDGEGWRAKLARARRAAGSAVAPKSEYDQRLPFEEREPVLAAALGRPTDGRQT